jgi:hypothetical protein
MTWKKLIEADAEAITGILDFGIVVARIKSWTMA